MGGTMRTKEARRIRNKGLKRAWKNGHVVATICEGEAFSAYGCMNCDDLMDFWDSPAGMNGPMAHRVCAGGVRPSFIKNIFSYFSKFFSRQR
tara:strand:- start:393 stop:668 length:276 start_codon:yes stop_codon:yes gene_type:complete